MGEGTRVFDQAEHELQLENVVNRLTRHCRIVNVRRRYRGGGFNFSLWAIANAERSAQMRKVLDRLSPGASPSDYQISKQPVKGGR